MSRELLEFLPPTDTLWHSYILLSHHSEEVQQYLLRYGGRLTLHAALARAFALSELSVDEATFKGSKDMTLSIRGYSVIGGGLLRLMVDPPQTLLVQPVSASYRFQHISELSKLLSAHSYSFNIER